MGNIKLNLINLTIPENIQMNRYCNFVTDLWLQKDK
jgi:hypothetical protein